MTVTRIKPNGQPARLLRWLRDNPGSTSLEITQATWIVNVTGRVSDLRHAGYVIDCRKGHDGRDRYFVQEPRPEPVTGTQLGAFG